MSLLLHDVVRCQGRRVDGDCPQRDQCLRYRDIHPGRRYAWAAHLCQEVSCERRIPLEAAQKSLDLLAGLTYDGSHLVATDNNHQALEVQPEIEVKLP